MQSATEINEPTNELGYFAKRSVFFVAGKSVAHEVAHEATPLLGLGSMFGGSAVGLATIGLSAGVSAALTQMDYVHRKDNIKEMYKEEIAARLKKPTNHVTRGDLDTMAGENRVIAEEMKQIKKQRTFGVGISFLASLGALAAVTIALPAVVGLLAPAAAAAAATAGTSVVTAALGSVGGFIATAATALVSYNIIKEPLHHAADQLFNLDYATTHDKIMSLKRTREQGRAISAEQVLDVYVSSNSQLAALIRHERGKTFERMSSEEKKQVAREMNELIPLERLAEEINSGKVNATELAFAVDGQISGVQRGRPKEELTIAEKFMRGLKQAFSPLKEREDLSRQQARSDEIAMVARGHENVKHTGHSHPADEARTRTHVERLGRGKQDGNIAFVERLEQQSAEAGATVRTT